MAVNKPKTEEKAKGLIGLKKGKKVEGAAYSVGNYKGKTLNLSSKDLGAAGRKAAANKVKIQDTNYDAASKKVMSGGKALTGKVDLGGGNMAVYRNGVRVRAAKKAAGGSGGGGGNGGGSKNATSKIGGYTPSAGGKLSQAMAAKGRASKSSARYQTGQGQVSKTPIKTGTTKAAANPFIGGRASGVMKKKDGTYTTAGGYSTGKTARQAMGNEKARIEKNAPRDAAVIAALGLAPLALAGGGIAGAAAAGRAALAARTGMTAARAAGLRGVAGRGK